MEQSAKSVPLARSSIALDRGSEPRQRLFEGIVADFGQALGNARRGGRIGRGCLRALLPPQRCLAQRETTDRAPAEKPVDPLADQIGEMLDFDRGGPLDA